MTGDPVGNQPVGAVDQYAGAEHIRHKPVVVDGKRGLIDYFQKMAFACRREEIELVGAVAGGDRVALHTDRP